MKNILVAIAVAVLLFAPGCTTTNPQTGEREYDPVKTENVQAVLKPAIASGVLLGIKNEPKIIPGILLLQETVCDLASRKAVDPFTVNAAIQRLNISALEGENAKIAIQLTLNTLLGLYNAAVAPRLHADIEQNQYLLAVLQTVCDGVTEGVRQAKVAGLIR